ncbi:MAG: hypothetical protein ISS66_03630 [Desulfobacteraceae bacterium]|nr:hypothetical protein [Desulfobacteraceae bacterium]
MEDLFDLLDDIVKNIANALHVELVTEVSEWSIAESLEVWEYTMKAVEFLNHYTKEHNSKARELLEKALKLEPKNSPALTLLSACHLIDFGFGFSESPSESFKIGVEIAKKALALHGEKAGPQISMSFVYFLQGQHDKAIISTKKAISIEPNYADACRMLGFYLHIQPSPG